MARKTPLEPPRKPLAFVLAATDLHTHFCPAKPLPGYSRVIPFVMKNLSNARADQARSICSYFVPSDLMIMPQPAGLGGHAH